MDMTLFFFQETSTQRRQEYCHLYLTTILAAAGALLLRVQHKTNKFKTNQQYRGVDVYPNYSVLLVPSM